VAAPYILARTLKEAHDFAREELGLSRGRYRVVTSPSTLSGRRGTDVYLVPGYDRRYDRFAMRGALRYTKLNVIDVAQMRAEAPEDPSGNPEGADPALVAEFEAFLNGSGDHPHEQTEESAEETPTSEPDGLDPAGEQITIEDANAFLVAKGQPDAKIKELAEEPTPTEETKRRRRRCKECGILVDPDEVEQHAAEHLPEER
jgi:hypothetical protein